MEPSLWAISTFWFFWTFREAQRQALAQEQSSDKSLTWASPLISEHTTLVREKAGINRARGGGAIPSLPIEEKVSPKKGQATRNIQLHLQKERIKNKKICLTLFRAQAKALT